MTTLRETFETTLGPELVGALESRGFDKLTPVQEAVLSAALSGRDLRISSQTGSGKTVAIGLAIRDQLAETGEDASSDGNAKGVDQRAQPRAIVIAPTRELAKQVEEELSWLYAPLGAKVTSVTGGGGYRDELRAFRAKPAVVVGTPGRLLDHLKRGALDASSTGAIVLDEADRMLDMGFREDIEAILGYLPEEHRTHLVSATFPREVRALADRVQSDPVPVEGTPLGTANQDIEHLIHLVEPRQRLGAIVNLLLEQAGQTLIFARTRADVADLANALSDEGFAIAMLSGEMEQAERNRALAAFKRGHTDALVATDVAARGIDVNDVTRVIHADPPTDADAYTHRSGRTGRAGKKGISSVLVTMAELPRTSSLLSRARVQFRFAPLPSAESLREARGERLLAVLAEPPEGGDDPRAASLAERILGGDDAQTTVARLVTLVLRRAQAEPHEITPIAPPQERKRAPREEGARAARSARGPRGEFVAFRVSWGEAHGAEARRLVAMMCRRGKIEGRDIGAIRVGKTSSVVEVSADVADAFEAATSKPDPRDRRVHVRRWSDEGPRRPEPAATAPPPRKSTRALPNERSSSAELPAERASTRALAKERASTRALAKEERASTRALAKERKSTAELPEERASTRALAKERASTRALPTERMSSAEPPAERAATRALAKEERASTRALPKEERASTRALPKEERASTRALPKERKSSAELSEERVSTRALSKERESSAVAPKESKSASALPKESKSPSALPKEPKSPSALSKEHRGRTDEREGTPKRTSDVGGRASAWPKDRHGAHGGADQGERERGGRAGREDARMPEGRDWSRKDDRGSSGPHRHPQDSRPEGRGSSPRPAGSRPSGPGSSGPRSSGPRPGPKGRPPEKRESGRGEWGHRPTAGNPAPGAPPDRRGGPPPAKRPGKGPPPWASGGQRPPKRRPR